VRDAYEIRLKVNNFLKKHYGHIYELINRDADLAYYIAFVKRMNLEDKFVEFCSLDICDILDILEKQTHVEGVKQC